MNSCWLDWYFPSSTDPGIILTTKVHPVCIPVQSNEDPKKWEDKEVELLGFATKDLKADRLKVAKVLVFNQTHCDAIMEQAVKKIEKCKFSQIGYTSLNWL